MKRLLLLVFSFYLLAFNSLSAQAVDVATARQAGTSFLLSKGLIKPVDTLSLAMTYSSDDDAFACFYAFNVAEGFVLVAADTRSVPILGYSFNGNFIPNAMPDNFEAWLEGYRQDIERGVRAGAPADDSLAHEWKLLLDGTAGAAPAAKDDTYLLTSTWSQGNRYNNYCPVMDGEHVVVGCVATAMAQIIRYWGYPLHGFGHSSYRHSTYGVQAVDFDTVVYDYSLMPDRLGRSSSAEQSDMVSRLCYHCGVTVQMNYQNPSHTSGSGAQSSKVPDALRHFGYTEALFLERAAWNDDSRWRVRIRQEIDARRPIYYSGASAEYGHAFVLDGYSTQNRFHFNWGWGGQSDGFYTLNTMQGFTSSNDMIVNIYPSGWEGNLEHFHVSADGDGDGTSWQRPCSNLEGALVLAGLVDKDVWLLEGVYTNSDTSSDYAFTFTGATSVYGGFAGTETAVGERHADQHPTILSGGGVRPVLRAYSSGRNELKIHDINVRDGYSAGGDCVYLSGDYLTVDRLTVRQCSSDSGRVATVSGGRVRYSRFEGNSAPVVCYLYNEAALRQSLVAGNDGDALLLGSYGRVVNSTVVSNAGVGLTLAHGRSTSINNVIWNNDTDILVDAEISDTCIRNCAYTADSLLGDTLSILLSPDNQGPRFESPSTIRGVAGLTGTEDWRPAQGSCLVNAGERLAESMRDGDINGTLRCRHGAIDLGCYETNYTVGIDPHSALDAESQLSVYPNPATSQVTLTGFALGEVILRDALGREVLRTTLNRRSATASGANSQLSTEGRRPPVEPTLNLAPLPAGIYFLQVQETVVKVVKK